MLVLKAFCSVSRLPGQFGKARRPQHPLKVEFNWLGPGIQRFNPHPSWFLYAARLLQFLLLILYCSLPSYFPTVLQDPVFPNSPSASKATLHWMCVCVCRGCTFISFSLSNIVCKKKSKDPLVCSWRSVGGGERPNPRGRTSL